MAAIFVHIVNAFGEFADDAKEKMPVMTYAGFGAEIRSSGHSFWEKFEYIVCDEMQNLVRYQGYEDRTLLQLAEDTLRSIAAKGGTKIVALSATPEKIRERFGRLCYDVAFDSDDLIRYETTETIPYTGVEAIILQALGQTGILYTQRVEDMVKYIAFARENGIRADGFWSMKPETQKKFPMTKAQEELRDMVLKQETFPDDLDLMVINDASETCIKIQAVKCKVDYMIIHYAEHEKQIQLVPGTLNEELIAKMKELRENDYEAMYDYFDELISDYGESVAYDTLYYLKT